jgi:hypothetical protein
MLGASRILVAGHGPIAQIVAEELRAAARPARRLDDPLPAPWRLRRARVLILADPPTDPAALLDALAERCRRRPVRRGPLRVILIQTGETAPSALPAVPADARLTLETLDLERQAARIWLARRPLHTGFDPPDGQGAHLLLAGEAPPARALAIQAIRLAQYAEALPTVTFACKDPESFRSGLLADYPQAKRCARLRFTRLDAPDLTDAPPVTSVFVCQAPPEQGLATAQHLARWIADSQGTAPLVHLETGPTRPRGTLVDWDGQIVPFSRLREVCRPEVLLDGQGDALARVIHNHYRDSIAAQGRDPGAEPAGRPWEALAASYRDANRQQADHLWAKLAVADCRAVPEELVESFAFAPLEVERLAVIEHGRWSADRHLDGWAYAPVRDNSRKHHPQLIPYADLSEPMKDLDRFAVRLVPTLLARSGRGVVRMLLVGVAATPDRPIGRQALRRRADRALERLVRRYPDRSLVLASTLEDAASRLVCRHALEDYGAALFLLCPRPLPETLTAQPDASARVDLLDLAARAERRIALTAGDTPAAWLARRAEILLVLGDLPAPDAPRKQVRLGPNAEAHWTFEY